MYSRRQAIAATGLGIAALSGCTDLTEFATGSGPLTETAQPAAIAEQTLSETGYSLATRDTLEINEEVEVGGETRRIEITNQVATYERPVDLAEAALGDSASSGEVDADDVDEGDLPDDVDPEDLPDDYDEEDLPDDVDPDSLSNTVGGGSQSMTAAHSIASSSGVTPQQFGGTDSANSAFVVVTTPGFEFLGQSLNPLGQLDNKALASELAGQVGQLSVGSEQSTTTRPVLGSETTVSTFAGILSESGAEIDVRIVVTAVTNEGDYVIGFGAYPQLLAETESANVSALLDGLEHPVSTQ
ncbi:hypothetical protein DM826_02345 [Halonotius aquaticus]|uniref:Uncharacterized protein n=1 Tax=Halonotius aquaticus TaxID=2216978 RepID=A0A3A6Q565_9EURY|nr:DUF6517 family protein [Halonotius aquaticus]RJX44472.1 hypothetical protein DM826_02345 [Halonotius aquaticus]